MTGNRADWTPSVSDVGSVTLSRTNDGNGNMLGTFTPATFPTDAHVTGLITKALGMVALRAGDSIPAELIDVAKEAVAIQTAMLIELNFFAAEVASGRSPYQQFRDMLMGARAGDVGLLGSLAAGVQDLTVETELGADAGLMPRYDGFPVDCGGIVGWNTRW